MSVRTTPPPTGTLSVATSTSPPEPAELPPPPEPELPVLPPELSELLLQATSRGPVTPKSAAHPRNCRRETSVMTATLPARHERRLWARVPDGPGTGLVGDPRRQLPDGHEQDGTSCRVRRLLGGVAHVVGVGRGDRDVDGAVPGDQGRDVHGLRAAGGHPPQGGDRRRC